MVLVAGSALVRVLAVGERTAASGIPRAAVAAGATWLGFLLTVRLVSRAVGLTVEHAKATREGVRSINRHPTLARRGAGRAHRALRSLRQQCERLVGSSDRHSVRLVHSAPAGHLVTDDGVPASIELERLSQGTPLQRSACHEKVRARVIARHLVFLEALDGLTGSQSTDRQASHPTVVHSRAG